MAQRIVVAAFKHPGHSFLQRDDQGRILPPVVDHHPEFVSFEGERYEVDEHGHVELPLEIGLNAGWEQVSDAELKKLEDLAKPAKNKKKSDDEKKAE